MPSLMLVISYVPHIGLRAYQQPTEICDNAIDDDGDGAIDYNDRDCDCEILQLESLIPNPSFEDQNCCPSNRSQLNCAVDWIQASGPTTDYIHTCGWLGWDNFPIPRPIPDGKGIVGFRDGRVLGNGFGNNMSSTPEYNWKEYAGACLLSPLLANTTYRFEFHVGFVSSAVSPSLPITFFGTSDCQFLPFGGNDDLFGCPTNGPNWIKLGEQRASASNGSGWVKLNIDITPNMDIHAIAIGPPCSANTNSESTYYFFDNLVLADLRSFEFDIESVNHPCADNHTLLIRDEPQISYQWYKDKIALVGETSHQLQRMYGEGVYQVRIEEGNSCKLTPAYDYTIPSFTSVEQLSICHDDRIFFADQWLTQSGNYQYTYQDQNGCDSTVALTLTVLPEIMESVEGKIFEGETYEAIDGYTFRQEGNFTAHLMTIMGCDSTIQLQLEYYHVYFPNVFSPNDDNRNDYFVITGDDDLVEITNVTIYDRWGTEVYNHNNELSSESKGWNGRKNNQTVQPGVFTYIVTLLMDDQQERKMVGNLLLVE